MNNVILKFKKGRLIEKHLQKNGGTGVLRPPSYLDESSPIWVKQAKEKLAREDEEYSKFVSTPYFQTHEKPTKQQWLQQRNRDRGTITKGEEVSAPVRAVNNYFRELKYDMSQGNVPKGKYTIPASMLAATGFGAMASAPLTFSTTMAGSLVGEAAVDKGSKLVTGKDWAENVHDWTGLDKEPAALTNPGTFIGGGLGSRIPVRARAVAYNNVTPLSYTSELLGGITINKKAEFVDAAKEFFTPKRVKPNTDNPKWMRRAKSDPGYNPDYTFGMNNPDADGTVNVLKLQDILDFRNLAWAKAMRLKAPNHKLYIDNGDGTYRYNMDYVNARQHNYNSSDKSYNNMLGWNGEVGDQGPMMPYFDSLTTNGGGVGLEEAANGTWIVDKWDLQPFKDSYRTIWPWGTKNLPFIRNVEAVSFLDGNPFILRHPVPSQRVRLHSLDVNKFGKMIMKQIALRNQSPKK